MEPAAPCTRRFGPGLLVLLLMAGSFLALRDFGPTWDLRQTRFYGERYFAFWRTGEQRFLDFSQDQLPAASPDWDVEEDRRQKAISPVHFVWPLAFTLAAASRLLWQEWAGLLDPLAAFHAVNILLAALLAWVGARRFRDLHFLASLAFPLLLWSGPAWFGNVGQNLRDVPVTCFLGLFLLTCWTYARRPSLGGALAAGLWLGLALGCKVVALSGILIPLPALLLAACRGRGTGRLLLHGTLVLVLAGLIFLISWPWLWSDGVGQILVRLRLHVGDFLVRQVRPTTSWSLLPLGEIVATTPVPTLVLALVGGASWRWMRRREQDGIWWLLICWAVLPVLRICLPGIGNYGGVRHFLEFWPGFAGLATLGFVRLALAVSLLQRPAPVRRGVATALAVLCFLPALVAVVRAHPYQTSFNNWLVGGNRGGRSLGLSSALDYWGGALRPGLEYLQQQATTPSVLLVPAGQHLVDLQPSRVPEMVDFRRLPLAGDSPNREGVWVLQLVRQHLADHVGEPALYAYCEEQAEPVHEERRGGQTLLAVYRFSGDARSLLERARSWFAPHRSELIEVWEAELERRPEDGDGLRMLFELRRDQGYLLALSPVLAPFVRRFLATLPADARARYQAWWQGETEAARPWLTFFRVGESLRPAATRVRVTSAPEEKK